MKPDTIIRWKKNGEVIVRDLEVKNVPAYYASPDYEAYRGVDGVVHASTSDASSWWEQEKEEESKQMELLQTGKPLA